ncbi:galactoside-binding lectin [Oesophagostomum dentatum]|uniref:Galectin n=1 Tax=Oesophagostomum dentatum TaxID=61180 RepID=A0A0B1TIY0_OESDE|nr:galactoside-binding lectin [Oesophagostomum dentatum]
MTHEGYEIWCNDTMVRMYRHRLPVDRVKHLEVRDGTVYSVEWFSGIFNLPYEAGIPGGALRLDHHCEVEGIPNGERFAVDLYGKDGNILFHFNPRFRGRGGYIVRNSYKSGSWVKEERDGEFPFKIGRSFVVRINNKKQEIEVYVFKLARTLQLKMVPHNFVFLLVCVRYFTSITLKPRPNTSLNYSWINGTGLPCGHTPLIWMPSPLSS